MPASEQDNRKTRDGVIRLRRNLVDLPCGRDNWQLVNVFVCGRLGQFRLSDVLASDARSELPYVVAALELLIERRALEEVTGDVRDHRARVFRCV
jgi:hypothetical protein